jgi:hypothetical protein
MLKSETETFVWKPLPASAPLPVTAKITAPISIENGMFRSEIFALWSACEWMEKQEKVKTSVWCDPICGVDGGQRGHPAIHKALFYWRKGEGWKIRRKPHWMRTLKALFPQVLKDF